ncbi:MAG: hypothetical protein ACYCY5_09555 [Sulfuricella sp.]
MADPGEWMDAGAMGASINAYSGGLRPLLREVSKLLQDQREKLKRIW